jgi:hypothetical protein
MTITKQQAEELAMAECARLNWPWLGPIQVHWGLFSYLVRTNTNNRGGNAYVRISKKDGRVLSSGFADR